jgi:protein-S-isoprenylcysteine O-methyltransferase Ste14
MYLGLTIVNLGQALLFSSWAVLVWAATFWILTASFVHFYEEPTLVRTYGSEYEEYRHNVHAWLPRWHPWSPGVQHQPQG